MQSYHHFQKEFFLSLLGECLPKQDDPMTIEMNNMIEMSMMMEMPAELTQMINMKKLFMSSIKMHKCMMPRFVDRCGLNSKNMLLSVQAQKSPIVTYLLYYVMIAPFRVWTILHYAF